MPDNGDFIKSIENATIQMIAEEAHKMGQACLYVEGLAKQKCPVDMGVLAASISSETEVTANEIVGMVGTNESYGPYVHNGTGIYAKDGNGRKTPWGYTVHKGKYKGYHWTHGQRPQPFLEDAKLESRGKIERILGG